MDNLVNLLTENPTYLIIAVVFAVIILFSLAKKLLKMSLIAASVLILWIAYTVWTGQEISQDELKDRFIETCLLYTSPSPRDATLSRMPSSA